MNVEGWINSHLVVVGRSRDEIVCNCPECGDQRHFYFNVKKKLGHCWKCDYSVNLKSLMKRMEDHTVIDDYAPEEVETTPSVVSAHLPKEFRPIISPKMSWLASRSKKYLNDTRKINDDDIAKYNLGYCGSGSYAGSIVMPVYENKQLVYFVSRSMFPSSRKYKNPSETEVSMGSSNWLFNIDNVRNSRIVVIVEGIFDAIRIRDKGVALLGHNLSDVQLSKLLSLKCEEFVVALDADAYKDGIKMAELLMGYRKVKLLKLVMDPSDHTTSEMNRIIEDAKYMSTEELVTLKMSE